MNKLFVVTALLGLIVGLQSCEEKKESKVLTKEVKFTKEGDLKIRKASNDSIVASLEIEIADDEYQQQTGLMYRKSMLPNRGMLFIFKDEVRRSFYMKNTDISLDIIYVNSDKEIVSIQKDANPLDPTSLPSEAPAMYVLEVNGGLSDVWGLEAGDKIAWY